MIRLQQMTRSILRRLLTTAWLLLAAGQLACKDAKSHTAMPTRDINAVLRDHDKKLMSIPGVVGVYVGLLPDGSTPCLKIMAATNTAQIQRSVPKKLEGYPVVIEETGVIRPLQKE